MDYRERAFETYLKSLIAMGFSEDMIRAALIGFETGFSAGVLHNQEEKQNGMIEALTYEKQLH